MKKLEKLSEKKFQEISKSGMVSIKGGRGNSCIILSSAEITGTKDGGSKGDGPVPDEMDD